jgi:RNA polymerase sigma-70 factor (ECF subfamily)
MAPPVTDSDLERIYDDTIAELYAFVSRRCGGQRDLAEDVAQETWLRAVREWNRHGLPDKPISWLMTVSRNLIINHFRRRESLSIDRVSPTEVLAAVEENNVSDSAEIASAVNRALTRIPPAEARLLESFHFDRAKMSQIAELYGITERAVEGRLRRARERLRRELEITLKIEGMV